MLLIITIEIQFKQSIIEHESPSEKSLIEHHNFVEDIETDLQ